MGNSSDVLAINHVILIAIMCISKYRYCKYFDLFHLFEKITKFEKCIIINQYELCLYADLKKKKIHH